MVFTLSDRLTDFEEKVYLFIKDRGEVLTSDLPHRMMGAIPNLNNKGLIEVNKKRVTPWASKKRKYVRVTEDSPKE